MNILTIAKLMQPQKCPYVKCRKQFPDGLISFEGRYDKGTLKWTPNGLFLFHYQDTHGFPHEMMVEELQRLIDRPMSQEEIDYYNSTMAAEIAKRKGES